MRFLKFGKEKPPEEAPAVVQTTERLYKSPLDRFSCFGLLSEYELYRQLRKNIPVIDSALSKLVLLMGDFTIKCDNRSVEYEINRFFANVRCGGYQAGFHQFSLAYMNQMLTYGTAVGEIVLTKDGMDIYSIVNVPLESVKLDFDENGVDTLMFPSDPILCCEPFKHQELLLYSVLNPEPGKPYGVSVLNGLQFVSDILMNIYATIGENWKNAGNVRFAVTYKPNGDADRTLSRERVQDIAEEWGKVMRDGSTVSDFVSVGDISVKVIGADNQILDSNVPVRQMLEQIVSKLSIPPYLLGLNQGTETQMSTQQADILTNEIEYYRRIFNGAILKIADVWQHLNGFDEPLTVEWDRLDLRGELCAGEALKKGEI